MTRQVEIEFGLNLGEEIHTPENSSSTQQSSKKNMQNENSIDLTTVRRFQQILGKVIYITSRSRPDAAHAANRLGQVAHRASEENMKALNRLVGYLSCHPNKKLRFKKGAAITVVAFADASFANEEFFPQDMDLGMKSTSGVLIMMNGAAVSWKSKLQSVVADSTGYAETIAAHEAIKELHYLKAFLEEMNIRIDPVPLMLDASNTVSNLTHNNSYKQSGVKFHDLKVSAGYQYVKSGLVHPILIPSSENIADVLTKSNCGSQKKFLEAIQRFFGSDDYEEWITEMIRRNFKNALSDKVPDVEAYIAQWLTNCR